MHWYLEVLKKYAVFSGRARRKEYWMLFSLQPDHCGRAGVHRGNRWHCTGERPERTCRYLPSGRLDSDYRRKRS